MSMPFFGKEAEHPPAPPMGRPVRTFTFKDCIGQRRSVEAHFIEFKPGHVAFWREGPDQDFQGTLILAEANSNVNELKEVQS